MRGLVVHLRSTIVALLMASTLVAVPATAHGAEMCYRVSASATTILDTATGVFSGVATFELNGVVQQVPAQAFATGPTTSVHVFEFSDGIVVTRDRLVLVPIDEAAGLYSLQSRLLVVDGGRGWIQLLPESTIDLVAGVANWVGRGRLCITG